MSIARALLVSVLLVSAPVSALAQSRCADQALDPLGAARRARSIFSARDHFERLHHSEQTLVRANNVAFSDGDAPTAQGFGVWVSNVSELSGYAICRAGMDIGDAGLAGGWNGFAVGTRVVASDNLDFTLKLSSVSAGDSLTPDDPDLATLAGEVGGRGHSVWGFTLGWRDRAHLTVGSTRDAVTSFDVSSSGDTLSLDSSVSSGVGPRSLYVGLGVPALSTTLDLVYDVVAASPLTYTFVGVTELPLWFFDEQLAVTAGAGWIAFEEQMISKVGVSYGFFNGVVRPGAMASVEFNDPRLRSARATLDIGLTRTLAIPKGFLVDEAQPDGFDLGTIIRWATLGAGVRGAASIYNSRYVLDQTGLERLPGYSVTGWGQLSVRMLTVGVDVYSAINSPQTLVRLADAANRRETGGRLHLRLGW